MQPLFIAVHWKEQVSVLPWLDNATRLEFGGGFQCPVKWLLPTVCVQWCHVAVKTLLQRERSLAEMHRLSFDQGLCGFPALKLLRNMGGMCEN